MRKEWRQVSEIIGDEKDRRNLHETRGDPVVLIFAKSNVVDDGKLR